MFSFSKTDALDLQPFEICSIRPPTENYSLTFRLTRNCYGNRCAFCSVYKCGAKFSRRKVDEVLEDIKQAKQIDDFLFDQRIGYPVYSEADFYKLQNTLQKVQQQRREAGIIDGSENGSADAGVESINDERMQWFMQCRRIKVHCFQTYVNISLRVTSSACSIDCVRDWSRLLGNTVG